MSSGCVFTSCSQKLFQDQSPLVTLSIWQRVQVRWAPGSDLLSYRLSEVKENRKFVWFIFEHRIILFKQTVYSSSSFYQRWCWIKSKQNEMQINIYKDKHAWALQQCCETMNMCNEPVNLFCVSVVVLHFKGNFLVTLSKCFNEVICWIGPCCFSVNQEKPVRRRPPHSLQLTKTSEDDKEVCTCELNNDKWWEWEQIQ